MMEGPARFDGERGRVALLGFLRRAAWRNAANSVRGRQRRAEREQPLKEGDEAVWAIRRAGWVVAEPVPREVLWEWFRPFLAGLTRTERELWELLLEGEQRLEAFVQVLGVGSAGDVGPGRRGENGAERETGHHALLPAAQGCPSA